MSKEIQVPAWTAGTTSSGMMAISDLSIICLGMCVMDARDEQDAKKSEEGMTMRTNKERKESSLPSRL